MADETSQSELSSRVRKYAKQSKILSLWRSDVGPGGGGKAGGGPSSESSDRRGSSPFRGAGGTGAGLTFNLAELQARMKVLGNEANGESSSYSSSDKSSASDADSGGAEPKGRNVKKG